MQHRPGGRKAAPSLMLALLSLAANTARGQGPPVLQFGARSTADGILVTWEVTEETNAGIHVLRSDSPDSGFVRITPNVIPAWPGEGSFLDREVRAVAQVYYEMEVIDRAGPYWRIGPVSAARSLRPHLVLTAEQVSPGGSVVRVLWTSPLALDHLTFSVLRRSDWEFWPVAGEIVPVAGGAMLVDRGAVPGASNEYLLQASGPGGAAELAATVSIETVPRLGLGAARPSPWQGGSESLAIPFSLAESAHVRLHVADGTGREVQLLANGVFPAGDHEARWDGQGARGSVPSGVYFYRLEVDGSRLVGKLVVTR